MTDREKAVVMAYTGTCMLTGEKFSIFHKYVEELMKRPVFTHELPYIASEIREKSQADFIALCESEYDICESYKEHYNPITLTKVFTFSDGSKKVIYKGE